MSTPALLLAFLLASLYGVAFFLFLGHGWAEMAMYWVTALAGFALGELASRWLGLNFLPIGSVNVLEASITSLLALLLLWSVRRRAGVQTR